VRIERENQTLATITIQNYFRMYAKLAGMTGTADTEAVEFKNIYKLDVVVIPPNKTNKRTDLPDVVYKSEREKFNAVVEEIKECHAKGQPVLVGTTSVEKSERVSKLLKKDGIRHNVLNAINHEAEANIIAQAGRFEQVTIATNMAGRGTDILLGGNPEFLARAEMENEWIRRAGSLQGAGKEHQRYEDALREMRERYDDEIQRAGQEFQKELAEIEERRGDALRRLTDAHRQLLELSPFRALRSRYEEVSSVELIPAVRDHDPIPPRYRDIKTELESTLFNAGGGDAVDTERQSLEELRSSYEAVLDAWEQVGHRTDDVARELDERRSQYERGLSTMELALLVKAGIGGNGNLAEICSDYRSAEETYIEAERLHEEKRGPYEDALHAAERRYEESRRVYVDKVEEIREALQKAPQEYEARYKEILEGYRATCTDEHQKVVAAGGLHILGTERHEARRIDNQLRGRGGRQGDPGSSRFFLSLEDDLLRIFGADRMQGLMQRLGMEEGMPIEHRLITRAIRNAQEKVEAHNFDIRKHLLEYDDVLNKQREVIYARRRDLQDEALEMAESFAEEVVALHCESDVASEEWDWKALDDAVFSQFNFRLHMPEGERAGLRVEALQDILVERVRESYERREQQFSPPIMRHLEKLIMLQTLDALWKEHLLSMDHLKEGIGLRGYGQVQPLQAYQKEGYDMFETMVRRFEADVVEKLMSVQLRTEAAGARGRAAAHDHDHDHDDGELALPAEIEAMERRQRAASRVTLSHGNAPGEPAQKIETVRRDGDKVGRNDPCPCGSGKKYKKCHGQA
jgi:preprotein translocase subunit SecA